jgi:hypothetical protein
VGHAAPGRSWAATRRKRIVPAAPVSKSTPTAEAERQRDLARSLVPELWPA